MIYPVKMKAIAIGNGQRYVKLIHSVHIVRVRPIIW